MYYCMGLEKNSIDTQPPPKKKIVSDYSATIRWVELAKKKALTWKKKIVKFTASIA